jgi:hypothetical protein
MLARVMPVWGLVTIMANACGGGRTALYDGGALGMAQGRGDAGSKAQAGQCPSGTEPHQVGLTTPVKLDLLFMIDDSGSMEQEQANLARNLPRLIGELQNLPNGFPDLHLGVVSSDMGAGTAFLGLECGTPLGDGGLLQVRDGCGLDPKNGRYLIAQEGGSRTNFDGDIADVFGCLAKLGTDGCYYEHQLESVRMALSGFVPGNDGFLRPDGHLAVVYITDEDDCSAPSNSRFFDAEIAGQDGSLRCALAGHVCDGAPVPATVFSTPLAHCSAAPDGGGKLFPVQTFIDEMKLLRTQSITISAIVGWPTDEATADYALGYYPDYPGRLAELPICESANGEAYPALRLQQFVAGFGPAGKLLSICQDDFRSAMDQIGQLITTTVENALVECR